MGKILGVQNKPLQGVSISIEGSSLSPVVTNDDGSFEMDVESGDSWLIINPLGDYKGKRIFLSDRQNLKIYLNKTEINSDYDELLYTDGYRTRRNMISSISTLNSQNLNFSSYSAMNQYFQGTIAGVNMIGHSGQPGSGGSVFIRGINSLNANNQPLYIVDGMPLEFGGTYNSLIQGNSFNPINFIEPIDIKNVTILKDGSGTSLYGVKGANGVVLIETLNPRETQTTIDFSFKTGINFKGKEIPQLNREEYKTLANEILLTSNLLEENLPDLYPGLFYTPADKEYIRYFHNYNWQKEVFTNSVMNDAYLSVKGGDAIGKYGLSVGYLGHEGIYKNTNFNRFTTRFVGTFNIFERLRMYISANLANTDANFKESALLPQASPILTALFKTPMLSPYKYDLNNNQLPIIDDPDELGVSNPTAVIKNYKANNSGNRFLTSVRIEGDISKKIKWNSILGLNIASNRESAFLPNLGMDLYYSGEVYNASKSLNNRFLSLFNNNYLSYSGIFNKVHTLSVMIGSKWQINKLQEDWAIANNANINDQYTNLQSGVSYLRDAGGRVSNWNWLSTYGKIDYCYRDKYLLELNISSDLSSNIGKSAADVFKIGEVPFIMFYAAGGAWRLSNENFLKNVSAIEDFKLRFSYGISGNDDIGIGTIYNYYELSLYRETSGVIPSAFANKSLTAEKNKQFNIGTDLSLFADRVRFSFDYYDYYSRDLLIYEKMDPYIGYSYYPINNGSLNNRGEELSLFTRIVDASNFKFDIDMNISSNRNKITSIQGGQIVSDLDGCQIINSVGNPANSFYGYSYEGVFSTTGEASQADLVNDRGMSYGVGDAKFKDISGPENAPDGVINQYDKVILGSSNPDYFGGLTTSFAFKRWGLHFFWQFAHGNMAFNYIRYQDEKMTDLSNQSVSTLNRWEYEGQQTDVPRALWGDPIGNNAFSSRWVEDASYLRLKQLSLSYTISDKVLIFRNIHAYVTAANLFTLTNYLGYDPEFSFSFSSHDQGIDYGLMPFYSSIILGIKFGL
ncbi:MAG TPA: SusC/RagA family TonB-linked outer membrane protein [Bacteroidales bacterium]|nr:SusC/RagA family TonB-linked outer membrane protein [Bacteroidales bacterium]